MKSDFAYSEGQWEFVLPGTGHLAPLTNYSEAVTLIVGDYNIDGFPDIVVIMAAQWEDPSNPGKM